MVNELEKDGLVKFQIIDADDNLDLCRKMGIQGVPTFIIMEDGKEVRRFTGAPLKKQDFLDAINE
jgi:thioredoxin-like negative regulator of GroEL